eukprot:963411-Pyramimonas_sp.AAC.1
MLPHSAGPPNGRSKAATVARLAPPGEGDGGATDVSAPPLRWTPFLRGKVWGGHVGGGVRVRVRGSMRRSAPCAGCCARGSHFLD